MEQLAFVTFGGTVRDAARKHLDHGLSVMPLRRGSTAWIPAHTDPKQFMDHYLSDVLWDWYWPSGDPDRHGLALLGGPMSGVSIIDPDGPHATAYVLARVEPGTLMVKTNRGLHTYFAFGGERSANHIERALPNFIDGRLPDCDCERPCSIDMRGAGWGYVVLPPTPHFRTGKPYGWVMPVPGGLRPCPEDWREAPRTVKPERKPAPPAAPYRGPGVDAYTVALRKHGSLQAYLESQGCRFDIGLRSRCFLRRFHPDDVASLHIDRGRGHDGRDLWHCFGCEQGGDIIEAIARATDRSNADVCRELRKEGNV